MAESKDEILSELKAIRTDLNNGIADVRADLARIHAKLEDVRNDIGVIAKNHLAPAHQAKIATGSGENWGTPESIAAKPR